MILKRIFVPEKDIINRGMIVWTDRWQAECLEKHVGRGLGTAGNTSDKRSERETTAESRIYEEKESGEPRTPRIRQEVETTKH